MKDFAPCMGAKFSGKAAWGVFAKAARGADICAVRAQTRDSALDAPSAGKRRAKHHPWQAGADHAAAEMQVVRYFSGMSEGEQVERWWVDC